ncbi:MAG: lipoate--protein ligase family protein [Verrucomicrobia bacterium]|nr:lipoate--protein ligase family protein [Verrucomicrobiota bacterium]MBI3868891.1 lipoate--protein ligase family protein [Verrucomicrobiota bacterium]
MSMEIWRWFRSGSCDASWNMAVDAALLESASTWPGPVLRFYGWNQPAATFGYFQRHAEMERATTLRPLIRRPTAGGLVPHSADWTYSLLFPASHGWHGLRAEESYRKLHEWVKRAFARWTADVELAPCCAKERPGECFAGPEKHDLVWKLRKIAGAAQRRTRDGLLIQGSIQDQPPGIDRHAWEAGLMADATQAWGVQWTAFQPSDAWENTVGEIHRTRYALDAFHRRR